MVTHVVTHVVTYNQQVEVLVVPRVPPLPWPMAGGAEPSPVLGDASARGGPTLPADRRAPRRTVAPSVAPLYPVGRRRLTWLTIGYNTSQPIG